MGTVSDYLDSVDPAVRPALQHVVDRAHALIPGLAEGVSYGMPALMHHGRALLAVRRTTAHLALYPFSGRVVSSVAPRLDGYSISSGTIRFSAGHPLPDEVLDDVIRLRRREIEQSREA